MEPIYESLARLGMGSPTMRFLGVGAITAGALWLIKPKLMFIDTPGPDMGKARPWSLLSTDSGDKNPDLHATILPWYIASAGVGGIFAITL